MRTASLFFKLRQFKRLKFEDKIAQQLFWEQLPEKLFNLSFLEIAQWIVYLWNIDLYDGWTRDVGWSVWIYSFHDWICRWNRQPVAIPLPLHAQRRRYTFDSVFLLQCVVIFCFISRGFSHSVFFKFGVVWNAALHDGTLPRSVRQPKPNRSLEHLPIV